MEITGAISGDAYHNMKMETRSDGDAERTGGIYLVGPVGLDTDRVTNPSWFV